MDQDAKSTEGAVKNWLLLETEIVDVLQQSNWQVEKNNVGDACIFPKDRELNITQLARTLSPRVLVRVTPLSVQEDA